MGPANNLEALLTADSAAKNWYMGVKPFVDTLVAIPQKLGALEKERWAAVAQVEASSNLTPMGKGEDKAKINNAALQEIDLLQQQAQKAVKEIEDRINRATASPATLDTNAALLREMQMQRAWGRIRATLDALGDFPSVLRRVESVAGEAAAQAAAGDQQGMAAIAVLREELPAYYQARRFTGVGDVLNHLTEIEAPHLPPVARAARLTEKMCSIGWHQLNAAFQMARNGATGKSGRMSSLPGFNPGASVQF